jgi:molybdopterin/thiamine biosynthesis adenylyltransferase
MLSWRDFQAEFRRPSRDLVDWARLRAARVLFFGVGGVGSCTATSLVRCGVGSYTLWDARQVGPSNLSRSAYAIADLGSEKGAALANVLTSINPTIRVQNLHGDILKAPDDMIQGLARQHDVALVAADDFRVHERLNELLYPLVEAVYPVVTDEGNAGEIIRTRPGEPGCVLCLTNNRDRRRAGVSRDFQALGLDFARVALEATAVTLSLLLRDQKGGERFADYVRPGANLMVVITRRRGDLGVALPASFLNGTARVDLRAPGSACPVCGG